MLFHSTDLEKKGINYVMENMNKKHPSFRNMKAESFKLHIAKVSKCQPFTAQCSIFGYTLPNITFELKFK